MDKQNPKLQETKAKLAINRALTDATIRYREKLQARGYKMRTGDRESLIKTLFKEELQNDSTFNGRSFYNNELRKVRFIMRINGTFTLDYPTYYGERDSIMSLEHELTKVSLTLKAINNTNLWAEKEIPPSMELTVDGNTVYLSNDFLQPQGSNEPFRVHPQPPLEAFNEAKLLSAMAFESIENIKF